MENTQIERVAVVSSCTSLKEIVSCPARDMYLGKQHLDVCEGIQLVNQTFPLGVKFDLYILSGLHGFISEDRIIDPYEFALADLKKSEIDERSMDLDVHWKANMSLRNYSVVIYLLGGDYLRFIQPPVVSRPGPHEIYVSSRTFKKFVPTSPYTRFLALDKNTCKMFGVPMMQAKGHFFKKFCQDISENGIDILHRLIKSERSFLSYAAYEQLREVRESNA